MATLSREGLPNPGTPGTVVMRMLLCLVAVCLTILSCGSIIETLVKTGVEIAVPQSTASHSIGDTLRLEVSVTNVSDTAIEIYVGEGAFWLVENLNIEFTGGVLLWAHNIGQKPHLYRLDADSQVTLALRFVEILQKKGPDQFNAKVWHRYSWVGEGEAYRYSIVSRDSILVEISE